MCYSSDARPPGVEPRTTAEAYDENLHVHGTEIRSCVAVPRDPSGVGVLLLPDNKGLSDFYRTMAARLAEQGHSTLAVDYFDRTTATTTPRGPDSTPFEVRFARFSARVMGQVVPAAVDRLRSLPGVRGVVAVGVCLGGRFAYLATATSGDRAGLAGAVGLYGGPGPFGDDPGPTGLAAELTGPILALFAGADESIGARDVEAFDDALDRAGIEHEVVTYPGAPHGFFDERAPDFAAESADVWRRILTFLERLRRPEPHRTGVRPI